MTKSPVIAAIDAGTGFTKFSKLRPGQHADIEVFPSLTDIVFCDSRCSNLRSPRRNALIPFGTHLVEVGPDIEAALGRVDELRHVIARIGVAPQQPLVGPRLPVLLRPIGLEHLDDLGHVLGLMGDHPVIAGQGEVLLAQVESGHQRRRAVDDDRLLVRHIEFRVRPGDVDPGVGQSGERLVVGAVTPGPGGVEHDADVDAGPVAVDHGIDHARFGERELLHQQRALRPQDERQDRGHPVIGFHDELRRIGLHKPRTLAPRGPRRSRKCRDSRLPRPRASIRQDGSMDSANGSTRVLVVDDDPDVLASLERGLRLSGFDVTTAVDGAEALRSATETRPDAIVLDINMPVLDGVSVVTALRAMDNDVPVCVLSARSSVDDRVAGLEAGADDYLVKPFVLAELVARVKALLRRRGATATFSSETITVGPLEVDIPGRRARVNGADVDLTKREFDLLAVLAEHKTAVLSRAQLLELVWGYDFAADTNVVDVFIGYLRRKLEAGGAPRLLHTVRGVGFVLRTQ